MTDHSVTARPTRAPAFPNRRSGAPYVPLGVLLAGVLGCLDPAGWSRRGGWLSMPGQSHQKDQTRLTVSAEATSLMMPLSASPTVSA